ncbi:hypothetical protein Lesp02_33730 [Lentzea sp. NBRC 105346]|nr:hypothetical protein Lesp02_33730 [Lentzea sp. NBRC 105346]
MPWASTQQPFGGHHSAPRRVTLLRMGSLVRSQTRPRFAIIKAFAALVAVGLAYLISPVAAIVVAVPIVVFLLRRAVLSIRP